MCRHLIRPHAFAENASRAPSPLLEADKRKPPLRHSASALTRLHFRRVAGLCLEGDGKRRQCFGEFETQAVGKAASQGCSGIRRDVISGFNGNAIQQATAAAGHYACHDLANADIYR
jgi:hypothetical protein